MPKERWKTITKTSALETAAACLQWSGSYGKYWIFWATAIKCFHLHRRQEMCAQTDSCPSIPLHKFVDRPEVHAICMLRVQISAGGSIRNTGHRWMHANVQHSSYSSFSQFPLDDSSLEWGNEHTGDDKWFAYVLFWVEWGFLLSRSQCWRNKTR